MLTYKPFQRKALELVKLREELAAQSTKSLKK